MILQHHSIRCHADAVGVPLMQVERAGKSYIVRAMSQQDAEETVTSHLSAKSEAEANEPTLL